MSQTFRVFIGYDSRQPVAFHVAAHSALTTASTPLSITRLQLNQLPITRRGLTEFTYSRFLVPFLSDYDGYSLFMDADVLVRSDLYAIMHGINPTADVSTVPHEGRRAFERASVMLFNNKRCRVLTPDHVQDAAHTLMDLGWASHVGRLEPHWNHLVDYDRPNPAARIVHFTKGVPCWDETRAQEYAPEWQAVLRDLTKTCAFTELMGRSVHGVPTRPTIPIPANRVINEGGGTRSSPDTRIGLVGPEEHVG